MTLSLTRLAKLYSDHEFAQRFTSAMAGMERETNTYTFTIETGHTGMPRASGVASCARKQLLSIMDNMDESDPAEGGGLWAPWMGFAGQALSGGIMQRMGYTLTFPEMQSVTVGTGHPDGVLSGLDFGEERVLWDSKVRGDFAYRMLLDVWRGLKELKYVDPDMYYQMQCYMKWLGLTLCMVTVHPHDRSMAKRNKDIIEPTVFRIFIEFNEEDYQLAETRMTELLAAKELGLMVNREFDPGNRDHLRFPCGYCPFLSICPTIDLECAVGERDMVFVTPLPELLEVSE